jgi:DNA-binding response OmpR family regulator
MPFDTQTPILFYSAAAYSADKQTALNSGAQAYLTKPTNFANLCNAISNLIRDSTDGDKKR